ncbi:hypothetical protein [Prauserella muralis]|uniref:Sulfotransferase family protein n=1 Tax=Prauserella muralis TaxID=588067 RepID=A0A2V4B0Y9_9PSEU|nr:hypothetical protein [Prauserella muralis]PXY22225.1 hypothetical protein BAY60_20270 [Prauserella muralis]
MASPSHRVYLHIGLPKTGTTSLQALMWHHREAMAADGVLYPGAERGEQHRAIIDVHNTRYKAWNEERVPGAFERVVAELENTDKPASVFSTELMAPASPEEAQQVLSALSFAEVHVVCTVRDFARQVPSVWQENVKTRHRTTYDAFLGALRSGELNGITRPFWDFQDLPRVLRTWGGTLPPERVHVVTVPPRGASSRLLWERFAPVVGLDPENYSTEVPQENFSLGMVETELLRRINVALDKDFPWMRYATTVKDTFAAKILSRLPDPSPIRVPAEDYPWICETAQRFIDDIRDRGYHVVGDLDDLMPAPPREGEPEPSTMPADSELLAVAVKALARYLQFRAAPRAAPPSAVPAPVRRLSHTLRGLSEQYPQLMTARRIYSKAKSQLRR